MSGEIFTKIQSGVLHGANRHKDTHTNSV